MQSKQYLIVVVFEPMLPERLVPKTSALDHSGTLPCLLYTFLIYYEFLKININIRKVPYRGFK